MKSIKIKRLTLSGDYRENGFYLGEFLRDSFPHIVETLQKLSPYESHVDEIQENLYTFCPQILEELKGLQEGLQLSEETTLQLFSGYDMPAFQGMGCTSFMTSDFYVRNYDFSPAIYDHLFIKQPHTCGNTQFIVGRLDGMNDDGLVVGLHFVNNEHYEKGFLCSLIVRMVLEMCTTVEEAIQMLQAIPHAASYNYSLLDRSGDFAVVEASPYRSEVVRGEATLTCVNMFHQENMKEFNRDYTGSSTDRLDALSDHTAIHQVQEMHQWFSNPSSPIFQTNYEEFFGTLHTVSYIPQQNQVLFTEAGGEIVTIKV